MPQQPPESRISKSRPILSRIVRSAFIPIMEWWWQWPWTIARPFWRGGSCLAGQEFGEGERLGGEAPGEAVVGEEVVVAEHGHAARLQAHEGTRPDLRPQDRENLPELAAGEVEHAEVVEGRPQQRIRRGIETRCPAASQDGDGGVGDLRLEEVEGVRPEEDGTSPWPLSRPLPSPRTPGEGNASRKV